MLTTGPRGTRDILPVSSGVWQWMEKEIRALCDVYGYQEIRTPIFEHTELFQRGIGESTDIVEKEMYTFKDRGERSLTLRPENTASVVRSFLEHKLYSQFPVNKLFYIGPMFRYDRPQAGRFRQFHQFGVEALGAAGPVVDAEIILLAVDLMRRIRLQEITLFINSVGCPECRPTYRETLIAFLNQRHDKLCGDCQNRLHRNPLRVLDCKNPVCQEQSVGAPELVQHLCPTCDDHFQKLQQLLSASGVEYVVNPRLVRGLDYYTKTAFEIQYPALGAQSAVCGGGRYDGLVEQCGGPATPGIGFAVGLERILLALEQQHLLPETSSSCQVYVIPVGEEGMRKAFEVVQALRKEGIVAEIDLLNRSVKANMKNAARLGVKMAVLLGGSELERGVAQIRLMADSQQTEVTLDTLVQVIREKVEG